MQTNWDEEDKRDAPPGRLHGYVRVSTREQAGDDRLSLSLQEEEIRKLANSQYPDRELILWSDPAQSAWSIPLGQRKSGKEMLEALQPGDIVVSTKFDRLFRSTQDTHNQVAEFQANGIKLVILQFGREPIGDTVAGKAMTSLFALFGELEGDFIRQRTADGRAAKIARGGFIGGTVPIGWRKVGQGREARLVEDGREQEQLKIARDLRANGETFDAMAAELNRRGYRSRAGTLITRSQVYEWLRHEHGKKRRETASERIREALAKRKAKGLPLGNPRVREISSFGVAKIKARAAAYLQEVMPTIEQICGADPFNVTLQSICDELDRRGIPTARGGQWYPGTVSHLLRAAGKSFLHRNHRSVGIGGPLQDRVSSSDSDTNGLSPRAVINDLQLRRLNELLPKLLLLRKRGWSFRKLSSEFGFERHAIQREFTRQRRTWLQMSSKAKRKAILQLAESGWSRQEIMAELHVPQRTVYRYLPASSRATVCGDAETLKGIDPGVTRRHSSGSTPPSAKRQKAKGFPNGKGLVAFQDRSQPSAKPAQLNLVFDPE